MQQVRWMVGPGLAGALTYAGFALRSAGGDGWWLALGFNVLLALACLPLAWLATRGDRLRPGFAAAWLLMWPNAPYMVTDLAHLKQRASVDLWLDVACYAALAACGLWIGAASLNRVASVAAGRLGRWGAACAALLGCGLCGLGIWLGRARRYNSWDALLEPQAILADVAGVLLQPAAHAEAWRFVGIYGGGMAATAIFLWLSTERAVLQRSANQSRL